MNLEKLLNHEEHGGYEEKTMTCNVLMNHPEGY